MKKYIAWAVLLIAMLPNSLFAYSAMNAEEKLRVDQNIEDNSYMAGGQVDVTGNISGDLFIAGGEILVTGKIRDNVFIGGGNIETVGTIGGDAMIAGGSVRIKGNIGGDLRAAGGTVILESSGSGEVIIGAGTIRINKEVQIWKDMGIGGDHVIFNGHVKGKADIFAENFDMDGIIDKDASIQIQNTENIHIGPNAKILGKLTYKSKERIPALEKIAAGGVDYQEKTEFVPQQNSKTDHGFIGAYLFYQLIFLIVVGSLILCFFRGFVSQTANLIRVTPGKSFLYGILYFLLFPVVLLLLFITVIGIPVGLFWLMIYIFSMVFAKLLTLVVFSELINTKWSPQITATWQKWGVFLLLAIALAFISGIDFIAALFAFGAIIISIGNSYSQKSSWSHLTK